MGIRQWVGRSHEAAMDHWERMGREIDEWVNQLPEDQAEMLAEWTAFSVYPESDHIAA